MGRLDGQAGGQPVRVAAVPEIARIASDWLETADHPQLGSVGYGRRELAPAEKHEIRRRAVLAFSVRIVLTGLTATLLIRSLLPLPGELTVSGGVWLTVLATVLAGVIISSVHAVPMAVNMLRDVSGGSVTIIRLPLANLKAMNEGRAGDDAAQPADAGESISVLEVLEHSRIVWTVDGKQAGWRLS